MDNMGLEMDEEDGKKRKNKCYYPNSASISNLTGMSSELAFSANGAAVISVR